MGIRKFFLSMKVAENHKGKYWQIQLHKYLKYVCIKSHTQIKRNTSFKKSQQICQKDKIFNV